MGVGRRPITFPVMKLTSPSGMQDAAGKGARSRRTKVCQDTALVYTTVTFSVYLYMETYGVLVFWKGSQTACIALHN